MIYLLPAIFSFITTVLLTLLALKYFPVLGLMDRPLKYGLKRAPIPYYGGVILVTVFFIAVVLFVRPLDFRVLALLLGAVMIAGVSFADDVYGLSPFLRLGIQVLSALVLVFAGIGIHSISNPLGAPVLLDRYMLSITLDQVYQISILSALFTILWVVAIINTMNFLDGLNGLPSGVSAIAAFTIFLLSIRSGIHYDISLQVPVAVMSIIVFSMCAAFWIFDFYPAKILMGDTGSMFLGFLLATLAIFSGGKVATAFLVLGFPILDAVWVILRRIVQKKSPFKGDLKHFHHRLLEVGLSDRKALIFIYSMCAIFGGIAVFLEGINKLYAIIALVVLMVVLGFYAVYLEKMKLKK